MKIGKTNDGKVWLLVDTRIEGKTAQIMLTWTPKEAAQIADALKKASGYAKEEPRIIVPRVGVGN